MSHPPQSSALSTSSQGIARHVGPFSGVSAPSRPRDVLPNRDGSGSQSNYNKSSAIYQGSAELMALMEEEQAALAAIYQKKIDALSRELQASRGGNDLLSSVNELQRKLEDTQKALQEQRKINFQLRQAIRGNGMELVAISDESGQKVDLRFDSHTQEVVSKFFHLPGTDSDGPADPPSGHLATSTRQALSPLQLFKLLRGAVMLDEKEGSSKGPSAHSIAQEDVVMLPETTEKHPKPETS